MIARPLRHYGMIICASPAYLRKHGKPRTPADLAQHECLDFMVGTVGVHWRMQNLSEKRGKQQLECRFRANNGLALRKAALKGFGIVMQAEILVAQDIEAGRLVPLLSDYLPAPRPMHLVYPRDRRATPKLTTFVDFVVERFGPAAHLPPTRQP